MEIIKGVTCDSRKVEPGYAFVAIKGIKEDGNNYINDAIQKGAVVIYSEENKSIDYGIPYIKVDNSRKTLAQLAAKIYNESHKNLKLIGVTGTNGKTTTSHLIQWIFQMAEVKTGLIGTVKIETGAKTYPPGLTTPDAIDIHRYFEEMTKNNLSHCVMEVSSHGIKMERVFGLDFLTGVFTNISKDHSDFHPDFTDYLNTKARFFGQIIPKGLAVINSDDKYFEEIRKNCNCNILTYGFNSKAAITASSLNPRSDGSSFTVCIQSGFETLNNKTFIEPMEFKINTKLLGTHNIYNILAAVATSLWHNIDIKTIQESIKEFKPLWRRLEPIIIEDIIVIDDCAHNPGNIQAVFESVQNIHYKNLIIIVAVRGSRGIDINRENGLMIGYWASVLGVKDIYVTDCKGLVSELDKVHPKERSAFFEGLRENTDRWHYIDDLKTAVKIVLDNVEEGDLVLLLGAHSMDNCSKLFKMIYDKKNKNDKKSFKEIMDKTERINLPRYRI